MRKVNWTTFLEAVKVFTRHGLHHQIPRCFPVPNAGDTQLFPATPSRFCLLVTGPSRKLVHWVAQLVSTKPRNPPGLGRATAVLWGWRTWATPGKAAQYRVDSRLDCTVSFAFHRAIPEARIERERERNKLYLVHLFI